MVRLNFGWLGTSWITRKGVINLLKFSSNGQNIIKLEEMEDITLHLNRSVQTV